MTEATDFNSKIITEFRATEGKVGGRFVGSEMLLLHHTGARTGTERVSPLGCVLCALLVANRRLSGHPTPAVPTPRRLFPLSA